MAYDRSNFRIRAIHLVADVLESGQTNGLAGYKLVRYAILACPWGRSPAWPYRVWLREVRFQLQTRRVHSRFRNNCLLFQAKTPAKGSPE